jgi:hypothetical protein
MFLLVLGNLYMYLAMDGEFEVKILSGRIKEWGAIQLGAIFALKMATEFLSKLWEINFRPRLWVLNLHTKFHLRKP